MSTLYQFRGVFGGFFLRARKWITDRSRDRPGRSNSDKIPVSPIASPLGDNSLRVSTLIIISATFLVLIVLLAIFSQTVLLSGFSQLEQNNAKQNVERVTNAIDGDVSKLDAIAYAWSTTQDIQNYPENPDPSIISRNFPDDKLVGSNINILMIYRNGIIQDHKYVDLQYGHQMPTPKSLLSQISDNPSIIIHTTPASKMNGIILLDSGPMLIASHPIVSPKTGAVTGTLIVGRYLDAAAITELSNSTQLSLSVVQAGDAQADRDVVSANQQLLSGEKIVVTPLSDQIVAGYTQIDDIFGKPALTLRVEMPRDIYSQGKASVQYAVIGLFLIGLISAIVTMVLIEKTVLGRLSRLTARIRQIGTGGMFSSRIGYFGNDEIGSVAGSVNGMLENLDNSHRALAKSEERYVKLLENANDLIITTTIGGEITSLNHVTEQLTEYSRTDLLGKNLNDLVTSESAHRKKRMIDFKLENPTEKTRYEIEMVTKSGKHRIIELSSQLQLSEGEPSGVFIIGRDITDRKQAESELERHRENLEQMVQERTKKLEAANELMKKEVLEREAAEQNLEAEKQRLEVTLASIADGVITTDTKSQIVLMNKVASDLTGWPIPAAKNVALDSVLRLLQTDSKVPVSAIAQTVLTSGESLQILHNLVLHNRCNREVPVVCSAAPIKDTAGSIIGAVIVIRDVSERLHWEEEMQKAAKLESVGVLAGGIAHDFNNILTAITGNIALAKMMVLDDPTILSRLTSAEEAALKASSITQQLITFSKGGSPVKRNTDIRAFIRETAEFVLSGTKSRSDITIDPDLPPVIADPNQISQVIGNLVINADQAMPLGGIVTIVADTVTVKQPMVTLPPDKFVRISISDTGVGIPKANIAKIFDPWFTTKNRGTGLGLASTLSIIQKHGGFIEVESEPGEGTTFSIFLRPAEACPSLSVVSSTPFEPVGQNKILLMDDDDNILIATGELLRMNGFLVKEARDGVEAIDLYRTEFESGHPFDAVIMDLTVPAGMGGQECIAQLMKLYPGVRSIVSSGYSDNPVMSNYRDYGFVDVLPKPYKIEMLIMKLRQVIHTVELSGTSMSAGKTDARDML